jgi:hypothetical protein
MEEKSMNDQNTNINQNRAPAGQTVPAGQPAPRAYDVHYHYYYEPPRYTKKKSSKPTVAGVLLIITAILGLIAGVAAVGIGGMGFGIFYEDTEGDIFGVVTYQNGTGMENVTVSIIGEDLSTQTDQDGYYAIYNIPSGNHKIKVEKDGYHTIIYKTFISSSDFNMEDSENDDKHHDVKKEDNEINFIMTAGDDEIERGTTTPFRLIEGFLVICGILIVIFSIFAMIGAIHALRRKSWKLALVGSLLGLFTIVGSLFAIIALLIIALSREEFNGGNRE